MRFLDSGLLDPWAGSLENLEGGFGAELRGVRIGHGTDWVPADGAPWEILGGADVKASFVDRWGHGVGVAGREWLAEKQITMQVLTLADSPSAALARFALLAEAWRPVEDDGVLALQMWTPFGPFVWWGRPARPVVADLANVAHGVIVAVCSFVATDPRAYEPDVSVAGSQVNVVVGGLTFPHTFPHGFSGGTGGAELVAQAGTVEAPWELTVAAVTTLTGVTVRVGEAALQLGTAVASGRQVVFDSDQRTVIESRAGSGPGDPSVLRTGDLVRPGVRWVDLPPGESLLTVTATSGSGTATLRWRPAWLL